MIQDFLETRPDGTARATLLLAHGAGAPMDSDFMNLLATALARRGIRVLRFEFPYMAQRREGGSKRPPNPMPVLRAHFLERYASLGEPAFVGGKSMGGRVASMVVDELDALGVLCFGYPFHPPGRPERTRTGHLAGLVRPGLVVQGTRDPFGKPEEVAGYDLSAQLRVHWLESGDHDFKPLRSSGLTQTQLVEQAADAACRFMMGLTPGAPQSC